MEAKDHLSGAENNEQFLIQILDRLNPAHDREQLNEQERAWYDAVEEARDEWKRARTYFESVSDPELVDHAIHLLSAAEKKYQYVLNKVRRQMANEDVGEMKDSSP